MNLSPYERDRLRKLRTELGETRTAQRFSTSKMTIDLLLYDGGVTKATHDRISAQLKRILMAEELNATQPLDEAEMIAAIEAETPLTAADIQGLKNCRPNELRELVQTYYDTGAITEFTTWQKIAAFMNRCAPYLGLAEPLLRVAALVIAL